MADRAQAVIDAASYVFELDMHSSEPLVAAGLISGVAALWRYGEGGVSPEAAGRAAAHAESCRSLRFGGDGGGCLYTCSSDKSVACVDVASCAVGWRVPDAHEEPVNQLCSLEGSLLATGDDGGMVKLWDTRQRAQVASFAAHDDFVSDFAYEPISKTLLSTGGDGTLCAHDVQRKKLIEKSEPIDDELLSVQIIKRGRLALCGGQDGSLYVYKWGQWGSCSDTAPGHPKSIDTLAGLDPDTVLTGSSDGLIRIVQVHPNKLLGVVGEHGEFPVECIALARERGVLASCSHDETIKLWDCSQLLDGGGGDLDSDASGAEGGGGGEGSEGESELAEGAAKRAKTSGASDAENEGEEDESESEDEGGGGFFSGL